MNKDTDQPTQRLADLYHRQGIDPSYPECFRIATDAITGLDRHDIPAFARRIGNFRLFWPSCGDLMYAADKQPKSGYERREDIVNPVWVAFDPENQRRYRMGARTLLNVCDWPVQEDRDD
jgi:hypothetical protein